MQINAKAQFLLLIICKTGYHNYVLDYVVCLKFSLQPSQIKKKCFLLVQQGSLLSRSFQLKTIYIVLFQCGRLTLD